MNEPFTSTAAISDCWNKIGVWGNGQCAELPRQVHCRNCPVYSSTASRLLDLEIDEDYLRGWSDYYAQESSRQQRHSESTLIFRLGVEWFGLTPQIFERVAENRAIRRLPHRRSPLVLGLANIHGELLICVSLSSQLGIAETSSQGSKNESLAFERLMVTRHPAGRLIFPVDEIHGIHRFASSEVMQAPGTLARAQSVYTKAILSWKGKSVALLDDELLFYSLNQTLS